jgi:hypothetical protein
VSTDRFPGYSSFDPSTPCGTCGGTDWSYYETTIGREIPGLGIRPRRERVVRCARCLPPGPDDRVLARSSAGRMAYLSKQV